MARGRNRKATRGARAATLPVASLAEWLRILSLFFVLWTLLAIQSLAQGRKIPFDHITTEEGLSHNAVNAILQDRAGFIWLGTEDGLSRFDGTNFKTFRNTDDDPGSLSYNWIWSLVEDREGKIWVGTDGGLNVWDPQSRTFSSFVNDESDPRSLSHNRVRALLEDSRGELWVGTHGGLNKLNRADGTFTRYTHNPTEPKSISSDNIRAIYEDRQGRMWVGTDGGGLGLMDLESREFTHYRQDPEDPRSLSSNRLRTLFEDAEGNFWVGTYDGGLNLMDREAGSFIHLHNVPEDPRSLSDNLVRVVHQDLSGLVWVGTDKGLNEWDPKRGQFVSYQKNLASPASLADNRVLSILQDRGGVLWVGTRAGVSKWNPNSGAFTGFSKNPDAPDRSLDSNIVLAFAEDLSSTVLWVGTYSGLNRIDRRTNKVHHFHVDPQDPKALADERVFSLLVDSTGTLWVGTFKGGLHRLNPDGRTFTRFQNDPNDPHSLASDAVTSIYEDSEGVLWVGTFRGGLNRLTRETGQFTRYRHDPNSVTSLSSDNVVALFEDSTGVLWVGTDGGGLNGFDRKAATFTHYRHKANIEESLSSDTIFSINEDRKGTLWIGTNGGGLNKWSLELRQQHQPLFETFREANGLPNDDIFGILEDSRGLLWLSTNKGISRLDPRSETFRNLDTTHGLQGLEFNFGAYFQSRTGEMFFGGNEGFSSLYPSAFRANEYKPPVVLTAVEKLNQEFDTGVPVHELESIELSHKDYVVSFEFAALDYTAPEKNQYAYKLEGFDTNWIELGNRNRATYTNLDPGEYVFRARGTNNDGFWSEQEVTLKVRVVPPWWQTRWAYLIYALAVAAVILYYLAKQKRKHQLAAAQRQLLEDQVNERTHELAERNDELERAIHQLELASVTDSLTGLRNRRFLVNSIDRDLALVHRMRREQRERGGDATGEGSPTDSLFLIFDLDGFKDVNDSFGHSAGDQVLVQVRALLEAACRRSDSIIRWGGDEFLIVARQADRESAEKLAERIRQSLHGHTFDLGHGHKRKLTCSIGFAFYPFLSNEPELFGWEQVITVADRALYVAKKSGRDAWVGVYETPQTRFVDRHRLLGLINKQIDELVAEGKLELRTSIENHEQLVWAWA